MLDKFLSHRGKKINFPKEGIINQSVQAKYATINATIGVALDDYKKPLSLNSITAQINLPNNDFVAYAPCSGNLMLRQKWQELMLQKNSHIKKENISLPVVTHALTHALFIAANLFIDAEDEIIIPAPYWENYDLIFQEYFAGNIVTFDIFNKNEFNFAALKKSLATKAKKKILLLNFPHNPTGFTPDNASVAKLASIIKKAAVKSKIIIIIDDAYTGFVYDNNIDKQSIFSSLIDLSENILTIKIDGISKEYYSWGLRIGFITYNSKNYSTQNYEVLNDKTAAIIRATISSTTNICQEIILHCLNSSNLKKELNNNFEILQNRFNSVKNILAANPQYTQQFLPLPFNSGYFMCIKPLHITAENLRKLLLEEYSTGVIVFGDFIRISYSSVPENLLEQLFENIYNGCLRACIVKKYQHEKC